MWVVLLTLVEYISNTIILCVQFSRYFVRKILSEHWDLNLFYLLGKTSLQGFSSLAPIGSKCPGRSSKGLLNCHSTLLPALSSNYALSDKDHPIFYYNLLVASNESWWIIVHQSKSKCPTCLIWNQTSTKIFLSGLTACWRVSNFGQN